MVMKTDNKALQAQPQAALALPKGAPPIPSILPTAPTGRVRQPATRAPRRTAVSTPLEQAAAAARKVGAPAKAALPAAAMEGPPSDMPPQEPTKPYQKTALPGTEKKAAILPPVDTTPPGDPDPMGFTQIGGAKTKPAEPDYAKTIPEETDPGLEGEPETGPLGTVWVDGHGWMDPFEAQKIEAQKLAEEQAAAEKKQKIADGWVKTPDGKDIYDPTDPDDPNYDPTKDPDHPDYDVAGSQMTKWEADWAETEEGFDKAAEDQIAKMDNAAAIAAARAKRSAMARAAQMGTQYTSEAQKQLGDIEMKIWAANQAAKAQFMYDHENKKVDMKIEHLRQRLELATGEQAGDLQKELTALLTEAQAKDAFLEQFWGAPGELLSNLGADAFAGDTWEAFQGAMNEAGESGDPFAVWGVMKGVRVVFDDESGEAKLHYSDDWGDAFDEYGEEGLEGLFRHMTTKEGWDALYDLDDDGVYRLSKSKFKQWLASNGWDPAKAQELWDYYKQKYEDVFSAQATVSGSYPSPWAHHDEQYPSLAPADDEYYDWSYQGEDDE